MKQGWEIKRLEDCFKLKSGDGLTSKNMSEDGIFPVFGGNGIAGLHNDFNLSGSNVIIGRVGALCGNVRHMNEKIWLTDNAFKLVDFKFDFDHSFLTYLLNFKNLREYARQAAQPVISNSSLKDVVLKFPKSLPEQQRIVAILDEAFAAIAKAKANAEQNLKNAKELFESYLQGVFEKKGEGWATDKFVNLCNLITCGVAATPKYVDESVGVPFLSAQNVRDGKVVLDKFRYISKEFHKELTKKNKPKKGDILYSRVGAKFGEAGVVEHDFEFSVYVSVTLIKPKPEKLNNYFLKYLLNSPSIKEVARKTISSSGVPNLNVKDVREFLISYPSISTQKKIVNEIETMRAETKKLEAIYQQKINDLEELKKSVLQKAFNGELKTEKKLLHEY